MTDKEKKYLLARIKDFERKWKGMLNLQGDIRTASYFAGFAAGGAEAILIFRLLLDGVGSGNPIGRCKD